MILLLEDDSDRQERFRDVLKKIAFGETIRIWNNAYTMIDEAGPILSQTTLISLDHDLEPTTDTDDPGEGYLVTKWLTAQSIIIPVIIHTSNSPRALWMAGEFDLAEWPRWRVAPLGDDWIESDWALVVARIFCRRR